MKDIPYFAWITGCLCVFFLTVTFCFSFWTASTKEIEFADMKIKLGSAADGLERQVEVLKSATVKLEKATKLLLDQTDGNVKLYSNITKSVLPSKKYDNWISNLRALKNQIYHVEATPYPDGKLWLGGSFKVVPSEDLKQDSDDSSE